MKKRALAALLALILCISCFTPTGNAAAAVKQQDVEVQLINLMKQYCGTYWAQNYYGARQCKGFADMISDKLFGLTGGPGPYSDSHYYLPYAESRGYQKIGILAPGSCTAENLRALFLKAKPGDYVQCVRYTGTQHSLIVADVHTTGVTFLTTGRLVGRRIVSPKWSPRSRNCGLRRRISDCGTSKFTPTLYRPMPRST